jgi:hypothetical protein
LPDNLGMKKNRKLFVLEGFQEKNGRKIRKEKEISLWVKKIFPSKREQFSWAVNK